MERGDGCGQEDRIGFVAGRGGQWGAALGKGERRAPSGTRQAPKEKRVHDNLAGRARVKRMLKLPCRESTLNCPFYDTKRGGRQIYGWKGAENGERGNGTCEISSGFRGRRS